MTNIEPSARPKPRSTVLVTGIVLVGVAGVLGIAGVGLTTAALVAAARRRLDRMEVAPQELARRTWTRTRGATAAGLAAWRDENAARAAARESVGV
jgi:hypothetical protein